MRAIDDRPYEEECSAFVIVGAGALDGPWRTDSIAGASMVQRWNRIAGRCASIGPYGGGRSVSAVVGADIIRPWRTLASL